MRTGRPSWLTMTLLAALGAPAARAGTIWVEGESAGKRSVVKHPWYDDVDKSGMSGRDWASHYDAKRPGALTYTFEADRAGPYTFWWRGNFLLAKVSYRLNDGKSAEIDLGDRRGEFMVSAKPDHRAIAWVKVGRVDLKKGRNTIAFLMHSDIANHGGIDCFAFDNTGFVPSGSERPRSGPEASGPADWFAVAFDDDPFSADSAIDVSRLVPAPAGGRGFLRRSGAALKFEKDAAPSQFWGVGANLQGMRFSREALARRARYLRKHGVGMVRQHTVFAEIGMPRIDGTIAPETLDHFDFWCAELKKNGIYMTWSLFYHMPVAPSDGYDPALFRELDPLDANLGTRDSYGLVALEPKLQDVQMKAIRAVMLHENPYTKMRPIDDPTIAVVETQNEDCLFFFNPLNSLADGKKWPEHARRLRKRLYDWAIARYKTPEALAKAWGPPIAGDDFAKGEAQTFAAHHLGGDGPIYEMAGKTTRAGDNVRFLAEIQRAFYDRRERELRELGFKGVTITTAWRSGGPSGDPANLWTDSAADMIDRHNYFGGGAGGHGIAPGKVNDESHLEKPGTGLLSIGLYQVEDRPFSTTEWTQSPPNLWKLEAAPLMAYYGMGLQGWDASFHFESSRGGLDGGWPMLSSYMTDTPHFMGQFPALAIAIRGRHITPAPIVAARRLTVDDLFQGVDPLAQDFTGGTSDAKTLKGRLATPPEALAVGRVTVGFSGGAPIAVDLTKYWDKKAQVVRSITDELTWDYGRRLVTLRTPKTQALLGRAAGSRVDLPGVVVSDIKTPFVSLIVSPLDDRDLATSGRVLVTAMARDVQTGARYSEDGKTLTQVGSPPLRMEPVQATLKLKGTPPKAVHALDVYGTRTGVAVPVGAGGAFAIDGRYRTYYYEVVR